MSLSKHKRDWDDLGRVDPLWAILTSPEHRYDKWNIQEFFARGAAEIAHVMQHAGQLGLPRQRRAALDFGCGVGRLTRALAKHFDRCVGVDISDAMISKACEWHRDWPTCHFVLNTTGDLRVFKEDSFDLVYSNIVLQHLPSVGLIESYIKEFIRILTADGLLVFQLPRHIPWKNRVQPRRRVYRFLRALGVSEDYLLKSLKLTPMRMNFVPEARVKRIVQAAGGVVVSVERGNDIDQVYYVTRR
ncbi:MAG: methyltransferase domain-containing protein [Gemmatimonadales bacterium]|nr:methyltransferase domain-containing protein [Gemmatimonadales bacterium]